MVVVDVAVAHAGAAVKVVRGEVEGEEEETVMAVLGKAEVVDCLL